MNYSTDNYSDLIHLTITTITTTTTKVDNPENNNRIDFS